VRRRPDLKLPDISRQFQDLDGNEQALTVIKPVQIQALTAMEPVEILAVGLAMATISLMTYTATSRQPQHKSRLKSDLNREMDNNEEEAGTEGHLQQAWLSTWQPCP